MTDQTTEAIEIEEPPRNIKVALAGYPSRIYENVEYFVAPNRTLIIGAQVTKAQRDEQLQKHGYIQAVATFNKDAWVWVEVLEPKDDNPTR